MMQRNEKLEKDEVEIDGTISSQFLSALLMIAPKLENWEMERIAMMDVILMKMAICEILNFESVPTKVSMNEYIEISKDYSTPKSKVFINGILDKILADFKTENKIVKTGRGLVE